MGRKIGKTGGDAASLFFLFCKASAVSQTSGCRRKGRRKGPDPYAKEEFAVLKRGSQPSARLFLICRRTKPS